MKLRLIIFGLLLNFSLYSQITFEKIIDEGRNENAECIQQCNDKGYIISGRSYLSNFGDYTLLIKTDSLGNITWSKALTQAGSFGYSVRQTLDDGFIVIGNSYDNNLKIAKTDLKGNLQWSKAIMTNGPGYAILQNKDSSYAIAGYSQISSGNRDVFLLKLGINGDSLWMQNYGAGGFDIAYDLTTSHDNGYILVGEAQNEFHGSYSTYILKTDFSGNKIWEKRLSEGLSASSVCKTKDKGYAITGYNYAMQLLKIDSLGNLNFNKILPGFNGFSLVETNDSGFFITGVKNNNFYINRTDPLGNQIWEKEFYHNKYIYEESRARSCCITTDNGFAAAGDIYTAGNQSIYFIKSDSNGFVKPFIRNLEGPHNVTMNDTIEFFVQTSGRTDTIMYTWSTKYGKIISEQKNDSIKMIWNKIGQDTLMLIVSNQGGSDTSYIYINVLDCVNPIISSIVGDSTVSLFKQYTYSVNIIEGTKPLSYQWNLENGNIQSAQDTSSIIVEWLQRGIASIKIVAKNQCGTDSSTRKLSILINSVKEIDNNDILVYPNPSKNGIFNISMDNNKRNTYAYNIKGELILSEINKVTSKIDLSNYPSGIYFIRIESIGKSLTKTIIKQ